MGDTNTTTTKDMTAVVGKREHSGDGSASSIQSSPEPEQEASAAQEPSEHQEHPQNPQKRKGGRKPIYATSEERKQRNRQAQAAFRERRTEYIKQLESTIKHHEESLHSLQQSHRTAADECLMLRYKNSLLERILLEKGIDVQAELQAKTSPNLGPTRVPPLATAPTSQAPMQRAIINRHHQARRSDVGIPQKTGILHGLPLAQPDGMLSNRSPHSQPTPTSNTPSPAMNASKSPNFVPQAGIISPNIGPQTTQPQLRPQPPPRPQYGPINPPRPTLNTTYALSAGVSSASSVSSGGSGGPPTYYPSPFQSHMDQLEQEYDAQADMIDEDPSDQSAGPGPFPQPFQQMPQGMPQQLPSQTSTQTPYHSPATLQPADANGGTVFGAMNHVFDPYDPILDADPFGLSASMHFPTQFSYETR